MTDFHSGEPLTDHPAAEDVAAYLSERLTPEDHAAMEEHLAECRECRQLVTSARRLLRSHRAPKRLLWMAPAVAAAVLVIAVLARAPDSAVRTSEPLRSDSGAELPESAQSIAIVSPGDGDTVTMRPVVFVWRAQAGKPLYHLSLIEASGRLVWSGETTDTSLSAPANLSFQVGRNYFWTVDAQGSDGRSLTTRSKRFSIAP